MSTLQNQIKLVYGPFRQSNMHSTLDFCPRPARKKTNVCTTTKEKLRDYCSNVYMYFGNKLEIEIENHAMTDI